MPDRDARTSGELYIGLMSGTSMDGIDAALVDFEPSRPKLLGHCYQPWPQPIRERLKKLSQPGNNEIEQLGHADIAVANHFSEVVSELLRQTSTKPWQVRAIGSHGQTVRHRPDAEHPFTLQIGDPNQLAEKTGIAVVADFRRRDMAAGGEGAPLAPAFHAAFLRSPVEYRVILNLGGIANITLLPADPKARIIGFDTGPANTLMDAWIHYSQQHRFDAQGAWAAQGQVIPELLDRLLDDNYFKRPPPKSTGPELFNLEWLNQHLMNQSKYRPEDIQASLCALSSHTIIQAINQYAPDCERVICCGGGTRNPTLMQQLQQGLDATVETTAEQGIDPDQIEAMAFAWLARQTLQHLPGNLPDVTGAHHPVILGGIYQARTNDSEKADPAS
ncbi:anhydro-N-acetylmuramic acid kinase [Sedimenticola selenatireducens]|uniref:Anhydro-N-acetylmuramic acid kinase n=1 Tax=Sedimenticola selenatireducens TaxID=191960 RepID=A0A2N6CYA3_9GAMM|nr:anhydro-N-acetylmuramic acid kinase [Sedimenticola selenatireducens]PLX62300.1 MAG: anhydro-N-acetylmuramic acid kinase [Sedimenticola selenatireducens]